MDSNSRNLANGTITKLLTDWSNGDEKVKHELIPLVYDQLNRIASNLLYREGNADTLDASALVHEVYVKMEKESKIEWTDRGHFYKIITKNMRQYLVDYARRKKAQKHGGGFHITTLDDHEVPYKMDATRIVHLHEALDKLEYYTRQQSEKQPSEVSLIDVIELRYFAGFTIKETAEMLGTSDATVTRAQKRARAWLKDLMSE